VTGEPDCPAPPCFDIQSFLKWLGEQGSAVDQLGYIWHEPARFQQGFYSRSHVVAYDVAGGPIQCAQLVWTEPLAMANIEDFLARTRAYIRHRFGEGTPGF
jgi:hypothetical protein